MFPVFSSLIVVSFTRPTGDMLLYSASNFVLSRRRRGSDLRAIELLSVTYYMKETL